MADKGLNTEIAVRGEDDIAVRGEDDIKTFIEILRTGEIPDGFNIDEDPDEVQRRIVESILSADSTEGMFAAANGSDALGWKEHYKGRPVELRAFRWFPSRYQEGAPVFVVVQAIDLVDGERVNLTTSGQAVLAQIAYMVEHGKFVGSKVTLMESDNETKAGHRPLKLVPAAA